MLFLELGINPYGEMVHVSRVPRGRTDLLCPYYHELLKARREAVTQFGRDKRYMFGKRIGYEV